MVYERKFVLGVPVDLATEQDVLEFVRRRVEEHNPAHIVTLNPEMVMRARRDPDFRTVISRAELSTADGAGILWALRLQAQTLPRRVGGSDLIWSLSEQASRFGHRVFLLGAGEGVARAAADTLVSRYPDLQVAGTFSGSPRVEEDASQTEMIRAGSADILFVAFGAPEQELWIARNLERSGAWVAMGVGGSFDYLAGTERRAPGWMQDRGLEWLWRLLRQPWRWRRMLALPQFAWQVLASRGSADKR